MAPKTLEQLKKERDGLLRKAKASSSLRKLSKVRNLEEKKLRAEISALKNPGSRAAKKSLISAGKKFGTFIKKRADIVSENLARMEREGQRSKKKVKKVKTKKRVTRKPVRKRRRR